MSRDGEAARVKNRDIPVLADVLAVMQVIRQIEERRDWQRERMEHITQHLTGMPRGGGNPAGFDSAFALISELDARHEQECRAYVRRMRRAQAILSGIEHATMRAFVVMRYMMDVPDAEIMRELNMTRTGFNRARRAVESAESMDRVVWRERYYLA